MASVGPATTGGASSPSERVVRAPAALTPGRVVARLVGFVVAAWVLIAGAMVASHPESVRERMAERATVHRLEQRLGREVELQARVVTDLCTGDATISDVVFVGPSRGGASGARREWPTAVEVMSFLDPVELRRRHVDEVCIAPAHDEAAGSQLAAERSEQCVPVTLPVASRPLGARHRGRCSAPRQRLRLSPPAPLAAPLAPR